MLNRLIPLGIPLAWLNLINEKKRFFAAVAGIMFAVTMMMFQMGLNSAMFSQVVSPHLKMRGDLVLVSKQYEYFGISKGFARRRLIQAQALGSVTGVASIYAGSLPMLNPATGATREVFILAFDPTEKPFADEAIEENQYRLKRDGVALYDVLSRSELGPFAELLKKDGEVVTEVGNKKITVEGLFEMGPTFVADGNMLMNKDTFLEIWPGGNQGLISLGLVTLKPGTDPNAAAAELREYLPDDVRIMTNAEFIQKEKEYWSERTPIGFVITASMIVSLIVGAVIVYQILYTDVADHLEEYATLKSIGFRDSYFVSLILQESVILSVLGFIPGTAITALLYYLTRTIANMPTYLNPLNCALVLGLTLLMCMTAGALATRKLRQANPAEIF
ncbi:ABC transporter permease DevC [Rubellicoccus peritrichatus]|uniref:ABC transporter permease DevC n=1 Tax=Rubellicoccus peritrichatus TaxID=3080537 RepID=A0AAQ3LB85_9BACT|nr:ABC transporter permease DevC [Puniceicoccus sp. CR14]WOO42531.1 ABC transporter permease DevC [Puniceicoccus sp. CR14]